MHKNFFIPTLVFLKKIKIEQKYRISKRLFKYCYYHYIIPFIFSHIHIVSYIIICTQFSLHNQRTFNSKSFPNVRLTSIKYPRASGGRLEQACAHFHTKIKSTKILTGSSLMRIPQQGITIRHGFATLCDLRSPVASRRFIADVSLGQRGSHPKSSAVGIYRPRFFGFRDYFPDSHFLFVSIC